MNKINGSVRNLFCAVTVLAATAAFAYACSSDDSPSSSIVTPGSDGGAGTGGSAGDDSDASMPESDGSAGSDTDTGTPDAAATDAVATDATDATALPDATSSQTCEPSGSFDNATRLMGLLLPDGGVAPL